MGNEATLAPANATDIVVYFQYDPTTGRILGKLYMSQAQIDELLAAGRPLVKVEDKSATNLTHYIVDGVVTPRPENPAELDGTTVTNVPSPSGIGISEVKNDSAIVPIGYFTCEDGSAELEFDTPGKYKVWVYPFPQLDKGFDVEIPG